MQPYSKHRPTGFDPAGAFLPDRQHWLVAPVAQTRDSGPLDESNFAAFLEGLGGESETVEVHRFGHWGPGWYEIILIDPADTTKVKAAEDMEAALEDYPVLDEEDMSDREHEAAQESWNSWARDEVVIQVRHNLHNSKEQFHPHYPNADLADVIDGDGLDELLDEARRNADWEYETHSDGPSFNIKGIADAIDLEALAKLCAESLDEELRKTEITKLCCALGVPGKAPKAIKADARLVSQILALP